MRTPSRVRFRADRVHTVLLEGVTPVEPLAKRSYRLTTSRLGKQVYLGIGLTHHAEQISSLYSRFVQNDVLGEWTTELGVPEYALHLYVHVGGVHFHGRPRSRNNALIQQLPRLIRAIRYADHYFFREHPELDDAPVFVHFESQVEKYHRVEDWGKMRDYSMKSEVSTRH